MRMTWARCCATGGCLLLLALAAGADGPADEDLAREDEKTLAAARIGTDPAELLAYFRRRSRKEVDPEELSRLVHDLGASDFGTREQAYLRLSELGAAALPALKEAERDGTPEVRRRTAALRRRAEGTPDYGAQAAAVRALARARPAGAAEAL